MLNTTTSIELTLTLLLFRIFINVCFHWLPWLPCFWKTGLPRLLPDFKYTFKLLTPSPNMWYQKDKHDVCLLVTVNDGLDNCAFAPLPPCEVSKQMYFPSANNKHTNLLYGEYLWSSNILSLIFNIFLNCLINNHAKFYYHYTYLHSKI